MHKDLVLKIDHAENSNEIILNFLNVSNDAEYKFVNEFINLLQKIGTDYEAIPKKLNTNQTDFLSLVKAFKFSYTKHKKKKNVYKIDISVRINFPTKLLKHIAKFVKYFASGKSIGSIIFLIKVFKKYIAQYLEALETGNFEDIDALEMIC